MTTVPDWVVQYVVPVVAAALVWIGKRYLSQPMLALVRQAFEAIISGLGATGGPITPSALAEEAVARVEGVTGKTATPKLIDQALVAARKRLA